jgi:hypothetical protein
MRIVSAGLTFITLLGLILAGSRALSAQERRIVVNQVRLTDQTVAGFERRWNIHLQDGTYWYDRVSGAWGLEGGPTAGWIMPGLELGGRLRADASHGNTGVFVNGRELHMQDVMALMQFMQVQRGRWWVDGRGYFGAEGGPVVGNLWVLARQRGLRAGKAWSAYSSDGNSFVGGDGNGCSYFNSHDYGTSSSTSWASPGC